MRRENLELRQQVGYWQSRHRDALLRIAALEQKIEQLEGEKRQLQADLFGRRSETKPLVDRSNHLRKSGFRKSEDNPVSVAYAALRHPE